MSRKLSLKQKKMIFLLKKRAIIRKKILQKMCGFGEKINIKARVKSIIPSLFQSCLRKMNKQIGKIDKQIDKEI